MENMKNLEEKNLSTNQAMEIESISKSIESQSPLVKGKARLVFQDEFSKIYEKNSIANYIRKIKNQAVKQFITEILILAESNCLNEIISKAIYVEYFCRNNYFRTKEIEILIICFDKLIQKNISNFYRFPPIFKAMVKLLASKKAKKAKIKFDWKNYYELFLIYYTKSSFEFQFRAYFLNKDKSFIGKFYLKVHKYLNFLPEDLNFLREEIKNLLLSGNSDNYDYAIAIMTAFLRKNKDFYNKEIQQILFDLFSNNQNYNNVEVSGIFKELVKQNNILIDKEKFLNKVLEKIHESVISRKLICGQGLLIKRNPISNNLNDNKQKNEKFQSFSQQNLFLIISHYLISRNLNDLENPEFINIQNLIKIKISKIFNILNFNLKENTSNDEIRHSLSNIKYFLLALKEQAFKKIKNKNGNNNNLNKELNKDSNKENEKSEKESLSDKLDYPPAEKLDLLENLDLTFDQAENEEDEEDKEKTVEYQIIPELIPELQSIIIEFIEPFITKSLFYQSNSSNELLYEIADISESLPNVFLSDNIFNIFMLLLNDENNNNDFTSGNSNWGIVKINCYIKNFFKKFLSPNSNEIISNFNNNNITIKGLQTRFNTFVTDAVKNISSANIDSSSHIIKLLSRVYNLVRLNYEDVKKNFNLLLKTLDDSLPLIYKKIIDLIEMVSNKKFNTAVNFFFFCSAAYINSLPDKNTFKKHSDNIEKMVLSHMKENILDSSILAILHSIMIILESPEKKFYQNLFDFIYQNLVIDRNESNSKKIKNTSQMDVDLESDSNLFESSEIFPEIKIRKNVELDQLNEKNLKYFISLLEFLDSRYIDFKGKNIEKIYNLIGLLSKSKDKFYLKILKSMANFVFNIVNKNVICFPKEIEESEKVIIGDKLENLSLNRATGNQSENKVNNILKSTLPDAEKIKFCLDFITRLLNPLCEKLNNKNKNYIEKLNSKTQKESNDLNAKWKTCKNKKIKKKIKKETIEEIINEKSQMENVHFKLLLGLSKRLNLLKNQFLLIPHKKNEKLYKQLYEDFNVNNNPESNSAKLIEDFVNLKTEINKKILESKAYFSFYKTMKTKEILEYYMSFDSYDFSEKISILKKFNTEHKGLLKKFKNKEKQIFNFKIRLIYLFTHLDLIKNFSHPDLPKEKSMLTVLINKILLDCSDNNFRKPYLQNMNYLFLKLHNKKDKKSFTDINAIYTKIKNYYEKIIDKINPDETVSISIKTKLSNLVYAYSVILNYYVDSPAIEYKEKSSEKNEMNLESNLPEQIENKKSFCNDFQINKLFLDFLEMKNKLYKQNIKELNFIVMNINIVYYNFFRFFPCSNFIIDKKLLSKQDYLHFMDYKNSFNVTKFAESSNLLSIENIENYYSKEKERQKIQEKIKFYTAKNVENQAEYKKTLVDYFKFFLENLKSHNNKITNNIYLNYLMKFEAIYLMYYSMDLENDSFYEMITEFQEYLLNIFISDCGFLEKKFCFYVIGFISKLKYKIIIEYKNEKFQDALNEMKKKLDSNLNEEEKVFQLKLKYFNTNKQAVDPNCPSDIHYLIEKTINYENLIQNKQMKSKALDLKIYNFLSEPEKLKKFVESYLLIKDNHKDQILNAELNELNSAAKKLFGTDLTSTMDKLLLPLVSPGKSEAESSISYSRGGGLMSTLEANMLFYTFIVYNFNEFDLLSKIFSDLHFKIKLPCLKKDENLINLEEKITNIQHDEKLDHVHMTVYLAFSAAHLRKMTINRKLDDKNIKQIFYLPLRQYGNISNEKVNREILTFYYFLLFNCTIEQLGVVLYDNITFENLINMNKSEKHVPFQTLLNNENLLLFKDEEFKNNRVLLMKFFNIFSEQNRSTKYIFENKSFLKFQENFLLSLLDYPAEIIKNLSNFTINLGSYIALSEFKIFNYKTFQDDFPNKSEFKNFLLKMNEKCLASESKKIKIILNNLLVNYRNFILENNEIFFEYLKQIINFDTVDADNYELVTKNLADIMITKYPGIDVMKILEVLGDILKKETIYTSSNANSSSSGVMEIDSIGSGNKSLNLNFTKKTILINIYAGFLKYYTLSFFDKSNSLYEKSINIFNSLYEIMNSSQYEIRDYISNELIEVLLMGMKNNEKMKILEDSINKLKATNANIYSANSNLKKEDITIKTSENLSLIFSLGSYLKFFDMSNGHLKEIDKIISSFKTFNSKILKNKGVESKLIKNIITDFFNRYKHTFSYIKLSLSPESIEAILDLSKSHSYFM